MKTATKNVKIRPLCQAKVVYDAKRKNFIGSEEVNYGVKIASMSSRQDLVVWDYLGPIGKRLFSGLSWINQYW
jgi:hypothetical protein